MRALLLGAFALMTLPGFLPADPGVEAQPAPSFDELGRFYVQSFGPEEYQAHAQSWAIVQSPDGLVYVGNGDGLLEYDGVSWRLIETRALCAARKQLLGKAQLLHPGNGSTGPTHPSSAQVIPADTI